MPQFASALHLSKLLNRQLTIGLMHLTDWQIVTVQGADAAQYLQGQVTSDLNTLSANQYTICAHCDAKGKVWSPLLLFKQQERFAYLLRRSVAEHQLHALKKYAVFSKVDINPTTQYHLVGVVGIQAEKLLMPFFSSLPTIESPVIYNAILDATLLYFSDPCERYLLIATDKLIQKFNAMTTDAIIYTNQHWLALDIQAGIPIIEKINSEQFIPQALNIQALPGGISFHKGCYSGQETVARAKYRGANKRALYWLSGTTEQQVAIGEGLEINLNGNWRRTGTILATYQEHNRVWIQAVLNNDLPTETVLRVQEDSNSQLTIQKLPYSVTHE